MAGTSAGLPIFAHQKITYLDWLEPLMQRIVAEGWRLFYLGAKDGVAERGAEQLRQRFPGLAMRTHHGYFDHARDSADNRQVLAEIRAYQPHILLVGMGMPIQERWITANADDLQANVIVSVGAGIDYTAGALPIPPRWLSGVGLEWAYRLCCEPRRLAFRYLVEPWYLLRPLASDLWRARIERRIPKALESPALRLDPTVPCNRPTCSPRLETTGPGRSAPAARKLDRGPTTNSRKRRQVRRYLARSAFVGIAALVVLQYVLLIVFYSEPYPGLFMPGFYGIGGYHQGQVDVQRVEFVYSADDGQQLTLTARELLADLPESYRMTVARNVFFASPTTSGTLPANKPKRLTWLSRWLLLGLEREEFMDRLSARFFPGLNYARRHRDERATEQALRTWGAARGRQLAPDAQFVQLEARWLTDTWDWQTARVPVASVNAGSFVLQWTGDAR